MSRERIIYDFCPKCGALMKNGVCTSCGYGGEQAGQENAAGQAGFEAPQPVFEPVQPDAGASLPGAEHVDRGVDSMDGPQDAGWQQPAGIQPGWQAGNGYASHEPAQKKHTGLIVGLCVGAAVITFLLYIAVMLIVSGVQEEIGGIENGSLSQMEEMFGEMEEDSGEADDYSVFDNKNSGYVPSSSDEYYVEIVDAVRDDLSYQVTWEEFDVSNDAEQLSSSGVYPQLTGDVPNLEALNAAIEEEALYYMYALEEYGMQPGHDSVDTQTACYVTYMDENVISIVLQERVTIEGYMAPELHAINIDVKNGVLLEKEDLLEYSVQLAQKVKAQNLAQNEGVEFISELSDEQVLSLLSDYDGVIFYTPVGMEIGFNYELNNYVGWVTVTLKDYSAFGNKF